MSRYPDRFLPAGMDPARVETIGLVSDTHMPDRCDALPPALFEVLRGIDLLLHAGDVGELWVLDQLSAIAPLVAVHGNDDSDDAQRELPYRQVLTVAGTRLVLTHGHHPDRADEMAARAIDAWEPKLDRWASFSAGADARAVIFGHTHIPLVREHRGVLLVNPGAIASGGPQTRQTCRAVALLFVRDDGALAVTHVNLATPDAPFVPAIDWDAGFTAAHARCEQSILAPDLAARWSRLRSIAATLTEGERRAAVGAMSHCARRCWSGEQQVLTTADLLDELARVPNLARPLRERIIAALLSPPAE